MPVTKTKTGFAVPARAGQPRAEIHVGDCRELLPKLTAVRKSQVDLVFADPPFNWNRAYDRWQDNMPAEEYRAFTKEWLDLCAGALRPGGAFWINIPDDSAAEIVMHMKYEQKFQMINWCVWHYRFGQNTTGRFINSKVHALYFIKPEGKGEAERRTWNAKDILELSDRRAIYADPRTESKRDGMPAGLRVPMDVWYGKHWGRVQGNNKERRGYHDNQLPEVYLERVIRACSNPGDLVMDPFTGSGTTAVVSRALGRRYLGTEFSEENAVSAAKRINAGPIRLGESEPESTAIHQPRKRRTEPATA